MLGALQPENPQRRLSPDAEIIAIDEYPGLYKPLLASATVLGSLIKGAILVDPALTKGLTSGLTRFSSARSPDQWG
jgi:hypothetical protein